MAYLSGEAIEKIGFKSVGVGVMISDKASIYNPESIKIGDYSRIDDFCVISGKVSLGRYCHITPMCLIAGGEPGIVLEDFCTLAYGVKIFAQTDDYSGETMTNSLISKKYKHEFKAPVSLHQHVIIGAGSIIFPGIVVAEGCSVGAMTLVNKDTKPWGVYVGSPARRLRDRKKDLLALKERFLEEQASDSL